jgi:tetratricopeptide (TPR) repeat protein
MYDGNTNEALKLSEEAFKSSPTRTNMLVLARQQQEMGKHRSAQELLEAWVEQYPEDLTARVALGNFYSATNQTDNAIIEYSKVLDKNPDHLIALNNSAWQLRDSDPGKALEYASRANAISPDSAELLDTLAVVLLKNGDVARAKRTISRAIDKAPENLTIRYHSAMIDAAAGDRSSALNTLNSLLEEGKNFPQKDEAIEFLAQLRI